MTEEEFVRVAAACDGLLRARESDPARVAVSWLHVLSEHPQNVRRYEFVVAAAKSLRLRTALALLKEVAFAGWSLARSAWGGESSAKILTDVPPAQTGVDVLIVSHLVEAKHLASDSDFYFGPLQRWLDERGFTSLLLLRNHTRGDEASTGLSARREGGKARRLLPRTLGLAQEIVLWKTAIAASRGLRRAASSAIDPLTRRVARAASVRALGRLTLATLRLRQQITDLCKFHRPRVVIVTYEGHGWERSVFQAARSVDRRTLCVGYQHTVLWRHSHGATRPLDDESRGYDPDVVLTLGEITRDMLAASSLRQSPLIVYGSHRRSEAAPVDIASERDARRCLVLPEGIESESVTLFEFALACARRMPETTFVFRTHPVLPFARLMARHRQFRVLPPNVELSAGNSLDDDCACATYVLYRGSSAVLYAVLRGVKPLYYALPGEIPFDPLFSLNRWREVIQSTDDLREVMQRHERSPAAVAMADADAAAAFCDGYVVPLRPSALDDVLLSCETLAAESVGTSAVNSASKDGRQRRP